MANLDLCCTCFGQTTTTSCSTPKCSGDCLILGSILADKCDSKVGPCAATVIVPFDCFCFPTSCDAPVFTVTKQPSFASVVSIDKTGVTFLTDGTGEANDKIFIEFHVLCKGECDTYSDYGSVTLYISDLCSGVLCADGQVCNKCTGICEAAVPEIEIGVITNEITIT